MANRRLLGIKYPSKPAASPRPINAPSAGYRSTPSVGSGRTAKSPQAKTVLPRRLNPGSHNGGQQ